MSSYAQSIFIYASNSCLGFCIHLPGYKLNIKIILRITKEENQAFISISTILKFCFCVTKTQKPLIVVMK